jgi:hypothetical protein
MIDLEINQQFIDPKLTTQRHVIGHLALTIQVGKQHYTRNSDYDNG